MAIKFCPNCSEKLKENKKLAQGVWDCLNCGHRHFILETTFSEERIKKSEVEVIKEKVKYYLFEPIKDSDRHIIRSEVSGESDFNVYWFIGRKTHNNKIVGVGGELSEEDKAKYEKSFQKKRSKGLI